MIPLSVPAIGKREEELVCQCVRSGFVSSVGEWVKKFENAFVQKIATKYAVSTSSGTAAIHLALMALGIGKGDYVAVPNLTCVATVNPVLYCGATPILVDVDPDTWCIDVDIFKSLCKKFCGNSKKNKLKAVIPVHLYGVPADMEAIMQIAREHNVYVIEDATEALGTKIKNKQVGTFGDIGCFSFNGNKLITTGSGGMVITSSQKIAQKVSYLSTQARDDNIFYKHNSMGFNYRMDSLSAAFGIAQLEKMEELLEKRKRVAEMYKQAFADIPNIKLHPEPPQTEGSFWLYSIIHQKSNVFEWIEKAKKRGIMLRPFFTPLNKQTYLKLPVWCKTAKSIEAKQNKSISELLYQRGLNLPSSPTLTTAQQQKVIDFILQQAR